MNIQTEQLADHTARMTVEIESGRLEQAKQKAARQISGKVNIPGFRKGKAPYSIMVRYFGEDAIVNDAFELLSNEIYRDALVDSGLQPYGPGVFLEGKTDPAPTMIFQVPLQPVVELGGYRDVRLEWIPAEVSDADVDRTLKGLQEQNALAEDSARPVQAGDRVTVDIHSNVIEEHTEEEGETEEEHDHEHDHDHDHDHGADNAFIHEHDAPIILDAEHEPLPGFSEALAGAQVGDLREFDLAVPDDTEEYDDLAGKQAHFSVAVKKIENITLPALNDELAARITQDEEKPLTLLELRMRVRENLERSAADRATNDYSRRVLDEMVAGATIKYPEAILADEVEEMLNQFDMQLRQQGFTLKDYLTVMRRSEQDMYNEYRPAAEQRVRRGLVMREIMVAENIDATPEELDAEINVMLEPVSEEQRAAMRELFNDANMRANLLDELLRRKTTERIAEIAKGTAPELTKAAEPVEAAEDADAERQYVEQSANQFDPNGH